MRRWDHQRLGVFGIGVDLDEAAWRDVFRQLVALGLAHVDHAAYGALRLTDASRPVLKGERTVEMRRTAPRVRKTREVAPGCCVCSSASVVPGSDVAATGGEAAGESGRLARLKAGGSRSPGARRCPPT